MKQRNFTYRIPCSAYYFTFRSCRVGYQRDNVDNIKTVDTSLPPSNQVDRNTVTEHWVWSRFKTMQRTILVYCQGEVSWVESRLDARRARRPFNPAASPIALQRTLIVLLIKHINGPAEKMDRPFRKNLTHLHARWSIKKIYPFLVDSTSIRRFMYEFK